MTKITINRLDLIIQAIRAQQIEAWKNERFSFSKIEIDTLWHDYDRLPLTDKEYCRFIWRAVLEVQHARDLGVSAGEAVKKVSHSFGRSESTIYRWLSFVERTDRHQWLAAIASHIGRRP